MTLTLYFYIVYSKEEYGLFYKYIIQVIIMYLYISILISSIGLGYFVYGKKQSDFHFLIAGLILIVYPYFTKGIFIIIVGVLLLLAPFVFKKFF